MRSRMRKKPTRVQFAAMPSTTMREPGTSTAAAAWKAAEDGSPGTWIASSASDVDAGHRHAVARPAARGTPARASIRSVWSRLGSGSTTVVVALGQQPGEQHAAT